MKRNIRLKEAEPDIDIIQSPSDMYLKKCNSSLSPGEFRFRTDFNGAILTGNNYQPSQNIDEVIILGDSFVESSFCHEEQRFASILERNLQGKVRVFNYGYSGTTTLHALLASLVKLPIYHPSKNKPIIFACIGTSDVDALFLKQGYWSNSRRYSPILPLSNSTLEDLDDLFNVDHFLPTLKTFCDFFDNFDYYLVLVSSPFATMGSLSSEAFLTKYFGSRIRALSVINKRKMLHALLKDFAFNENKNFLDVHQALNGNTDYFYDDRHLNSIGSVKVAECFQVYLQNKLKG